MFKNSGFLIYFAVKKTSKQAKSIKLFQLNEAVIVNIEIKKALDVVPWKYCRNFPENLLNLGC